MSRFPERTYLAALVLRAQEGDPGSLDELMRAVRAPLLAWIRGRCRGNPDAEDILQEALIELAGRIGELREPEAVTAWLRSVAARKIAEAARKRERSQVLDGVHREYAEPERTAAERLERQEGRVAMAAALQALSPQDRRTLELFYFHAESVRGMARLLDISEGAVRKRLHDARQRLRGILVGRDLPGWKRAGSTTTR